jgi:hypothetical protein
LQDGTCQPIIKNPEEIYTKEERQLNFLKRLLQELQKEVAPTSKGLNWIIDFNWLSTLENFSNIDIKYSQFQNQDIVNFDFNRFTQEMNQQQEKIRKVLSSIKSDFGSVKSTKISIDAMGDRERAGVRCDVKSTTIIELPNKETRELVITPDCYARYGFNFSIKPINATEFSTGFDYRIHSQEKNLASLSLPSKNICDPAEKVALHCALEYAKLVGVHALKTVDVSGFYKKAPPYCRIKLLKEMGFQYIGQREIQGDAYTNESVYQISLTE